MFKPCLFDNNLPLLPGLHIFMYLLGLGWGPNGTYVSGEQGRWPLPLPPLPWGLALVSVEWEGSGKAKEVEEWAGMGGGRG